MKSMRSPIALAAAAAIAAPHAGAQPLQLTPAAAQPSTPEREQGPAGPLPRDLTLTPAAPEHAAPSAESQPTQEAAQAAPTQQAVAAPAPPPPRLAPAPTATVSAGVHEDYTRLVFRFEGPTTVTPLLEAGRLDLRFSRAADLDIAALRSTPPRFVRDARRVGAAGAHVRVLLTLEPGVRQRHFIDGDNVVVDLLPPTADSSGQAQNAENAAPAAAPVTGRAHVELAEAANETRISVRWPQAARAAAFRRGEAIWLMFDAAGQIDLEGVARVGRRHQDMQVVRGQNVVGLRIPAPPDVLVSAEAHGAEWRFTLGARAAGHEAATLRREINADGRARLAASFGREGVVRWVVDPEIGDRIAMALLPGPAMGVDTRRATLEAAVLPAAHGAVIETRADGVAVSFSEGLLQVAHGEEALAAAATAAPGLDAALLEQTLAVSNTPAPTPETPLEQVRERIDELTRRAADEGVAEGASVEARMALARYLIEHELAAEALGALRIVAINQGEFAETDSEFRLLRGQASAMMGRYAAAQADLSASALADDPLAALWRGYAAAMQMNWSVARQQLERGAGALEQLAPQWRARFQLALAQAAFELNDYAAAEAAGRAALGQAGDEAVQLGAELVQARLLAARGQNADALVTLDRLARSRDDEIAVRAAAEAIRQRRGNGVMRAVDAVEPLEALRYRWRGDSTELTVIGMLGEAYSELGRWRDALAAMRTASDRFPEQPVARQLRADMTTLFERLFLDGEADQLEPIQALGLFYEFSDLTPVGPNGDRIVRLLSGRLVDVDLLEPAARLLQHQVDERLQGVSRAYVAADLAAIYLMDRKPDRALSALATTRQPNMPATLLADRRILEARALLELGRFDAAREQVERDRSETAQRVRAEAAWRQRDWQRAGAELRTLMSMRDRSQPLDGSARQVVLRTAVALTLAGNDEGVRALYREYAGDLADTPEASAFEVVAAGVHADGAGIRDVARAVAQTDLLDRFMNDLRSRMTAEVAQGQAPRRASASGIPQPPAAAPAAEADSRPARAGA